MKKTNPGFTLVELVVSIAAAAIVLFAAAAFMLLGIRMENRSFENVSEQQSVRIILTFVENIVTNGELSYIEETDDAWSLKGADGGELLTYADGSLEIGGSVIMDGISSATAKVDDEGLFTLTIEIEDRVYKTAVYDRTESIQNMPPAEGGTPAVMSITPPEEDEAAQEAGREELLALLAGQLGSSGEIVGHVPTDEEPWTYFSEWYIHRQGGAYTDSDWSGWSNLTPWCACFISWAADRLGEEYLDTVPYFADVDDGIKSFKLAGQWLESSMEPAPGDLIFFDWDKDADPDHVGAVLNVDTANSYIYTIEGNSDGVAKVSRYSVGSDDILGYGVLDWKVTEP